MNKTLPQGFRAAGKHAQQHRQPAARQVARDAGAVDAAADHGNVHLRANIDVRHLPIMFVVTSFSNQDYPDVCSTRFD